MCHRLHFPAAGSEVGRFAQLTLQGAVSPEVDLQKQGEASGLPLWTCGQPLCMARAVSPLSGAPQHVRASAPPPRAQGQAQGRVSAGSFELRKGGKKTRMRTVLPPVCLSKRPSPRTVQVGAVPPVGDRSLDDPGDPDSGVLEPRRNEAWELPCQRLRG